MKNFKVASKRRNVILMHLATAFCLLILGCFQSAQAQTVTFAQFQQRFAENAFIFSNNFSNASLQTQPGGTLVYFQFNNIPGLPAELQGIQLATLTLSAGTTTPAVLGAAPNGVRQNFQSVVIQITRDNPASVGTGTRRNLLTVTVNTGNPALVGDINDSSASFLASTPSENVVFTSDFINFIGSTQRNLAISLSSINPVLSGGPNGFLRNFTAAGTGTFAANPGPVVCGSPGGPACIPTPAPVSVSGRVIAPNRRGLSNALVNLIEADGTVHTVRTTAFGYYRFNDITAGQTVTVTVNSKRFNFAPTILTLNEEVDNLNLISDQQ